MCSACSAIAKRAAQLAPVDVTAPVPDQQRLARRVRLLRALDAALLGVGWIRETQSVVVGAAWENADLRDRAE
jgi:hypothetical protein